MINNRSHVSCLRTNVPDGAVVFGMSRNYDVCTELLFLIDEEDAPVESKGEHGARVAQTA